MDWKDEEVEQAWVAWRAKREDFDPADALNEAMRRVMTRAVDLAAARGGTMTAGELQDIDSPHGYPNWDVLWPQLREHISALGARNAVLEAEREDYRNKMELAQEGEAERDRAMHEAQDEVEKLRERLSAAEDGNRELVRRAQQAEGEARYWQKEHAVMVIQAKDAREEARSLRDRCERLSAAGQVLSAHVDKAGIEKCSGESDCGCYECSNPTRYPCSPTCTHDDAATPGHPERLKERSEAFNNVATPDSHPESFPARADEDTTAAEAVAKTVGGMEMLRVCKTPAERSAFINGQEDGAEAMRAACWEAVLPVAADMGLSAHQLDRLMSAIEGARP